MIQKMDGSVKLWLMYLCITPLLLWCINYLPRYDTYITVITWAVLGRAYNASRYIGSPFTGSMTLNILVNYFLDIRAQDLETPSYSL